MCPRTAADAKRILVVDDDDAIRALLYTILRRRRLSVDTAHNGVEALELIEANDYALVLLDMMMPRMNGQELLEPLSSMDHKTRPRVLVLTAGTEPRDFDPKLVSGCMRKP